jgi:ubiquinone/menaquinone biosynthesis C-methylase UbiE
MWRFGDTVWTTCLPACVLILTGSSVEAGSDRDRVHQFEEQTVTISDFAADGWVLDIGGGGEGIIGRLKGPQVVAIDISERELREAPDGPLKIVMDARELGFLDGTFQTATCFFTLMYIDGSDHEKVFREVHRVLAPGGRFLVWDVVLPAEHDEGKEIAVFPLRIRLPDKEVETGYGTHWPERDQNLAHYVRIAEAAGFEVKQSQEKGRWLSLKLVKP